MPESYPVLTYLDPRAVARALFVLVEEAACMECGYAYTYELEGCDSCRAITEVLQQHDMSDSVDR